MSDRRLRFEIFRLNPCEAAPRPRMDSFELDETPYMTLYVALNRIREEHDPSLQFDFVCRAAACGSCGMLVNGRPALACRTLTAHLPPTIRLHPLPVFRLVGDLSVDTGTWFRALAERVEGWIHADAPFDAEAQEARMDDDLARAIYEADRCIECGCCIAGCAAANLRPEFLGPAGLNRVGRFMLDPRDERGTGEWFEVLASDEGVFGCLGMMACEDVCPKGLSLLEMHAYLRRRVLAAGFGGDRG